METLDTPIPAHVPPHLVRTLTVGNTPNALDDPFLVTRALQNKDVPPIFFVPSSLGRVQGGGTWVVTRYDDIRAVYQDADTFSSDGIGGFQFLAGETWPMIPLAVDAPAHPRYRAMLNPWFSPQSVDAMEGRIRATASRLIDAIITKGECEFNRDFARPYPVTIFLHLMGLPLSQYEPFLEWENKVLHPKSREEQTEGVKSIIAYLRGFIAERTKAPEADLASYIIHAKIDGKPLTSDEILGTIFMLFIGGLDTVAASLGLMFKWLALHPEARDRLAASPALIPDAVEELLRMNPVVNSPRFVKRDTVFRGVTMKAGDAVSCMNAAGNFDPAQYDAPRDVIFERQPNRHLTLAAGPHRCLGSHLARRELRIALQEWLARIPDFKIKPGETVVAYPGLTGVPALPLVWPVRGT